MIPIFYNERAKRYYLRPETKLKCNLCNIDIEESFLLNTCHNRLCGEIEQRPYCLNCSQKVKKILDGCLTLVSLEQIPKNSIPVLPEAFIDRYTQNANSIGGLIMSDADIEKDKRKGINLDMSRCKLAGRDSWEGASIGLMPEERKQITNEEELKKELSILKEARPEIDHKDKNKLEHKEE